MVIDNPYRPTYTHFYDCPEELSLPIYALYKVDQTEVLVGYRPNLRLHRDEHEHYPMNSRLYNSINSFINVGDNFVGHREDKLNSYFPFNEAGVPTIESVCAALETLDYQIRVLKLKRIYIHCDLGSHRAPSIFGMYLFAFQAGHIRKITQGRVTVNIEERGWSDPRYYLRTYLKKSDGLYPFLRNLKKFKKQTTSLEGYFRSKEMRETKLIVYNSRKYDMTNDSENEQLFQTRFYFKALRESLSREFIPFVSHIKHTFIRSPYTIVKIEVNILIGTKMGKFWKKNKFGINWTKKRENLINSLKRFIKK